LRDSCPDFEVTAAANLEDSVDEASLNRIAIVVVGGETLERCGEWIDQELAWLRSNRPNVPVVAILAADAASKADGWITEFKLSGYILTSSSTEVASAALRLVLAGGQYFPRASGDRRSGQDVSSQLQLKPPDNFPASRLTLREQDVVRHLGRGSPNKIIARELNMSLSTVKAHVHSIMKKLNVKNRTEAAVTATTVR
jgi:DNA-binding NarL/FixJ family response regulator